MAKFKVGDKVRVLDDSGRGAHRTFIKDSIFTVKIPDVDSDGRYVRLEEFPNDWYTKRFELVLQKAEQVKKEPKFKKGDKVKILDDNGAPEELVGTIGTIIRVGREDIYEVSTVDDDSWLYSEEHLELAAPAKRFFVLVGMSSALTYDEALERAKTQATTYKATYTIFEAYESVTATTTHEVKRL